MMGMNNPPSPWGENAPEPLLDLCARHIACNPLTFCDHTSEPDYWFWTLKPNIVLPSEICEKLICIWQDIGSQKLDNRFIEIFRDLNSTRLKRAMLKGSNVTDDGVKLLLNHNLVELDISVCQNLTENTLEYINDKGGNLLSLVVGQKTDIFPDLKDCDDKENIIAVMEEQGYVLKTPFLRRLVIRDLQMDPDFFLFY